MNKKFNVSLVTYNTSIDDVSRLIETFCESTLLNNFYIIDNSPKVNNQYTSGTDYSNLKYIHVNKNIGYGAGHNIAIRKTIISNIEYHIVINPDIYLNISDISSLLLFLDDKKNVGQLMPKILDRSGNIQRVAKLLPSPIDLFIRGFLSNKILKNRNYIYELGGYNYNKTIEVPYLSGCFMFLRTNCLKKIGFFDERFFMYPEDIDLTRRMHKKFKTILYPKVSIIHRHEKASSKSFRMKLIHAYNIIKYFNKWGWFFDKERKKINEKTKSQYL